MTSPFDARAFQSKLQRLEALLSDVERSADPAAQNRTRQIVQLVLDLHEAGLQRLLGHLEPAALDACAGDDVIAGLLLLHGLHPLGVEARVRQALEQVRRHGAVELLGVSDGVVRLRLEGGCPSSAAALRQLVEEVVLAQAPEVTAVEIEAATDGRALVALPML